MPHCFLLYALMEANVKEEERIRGDRGKEMKKKKKKNRERQWQKHQKWRKRKC
jgi:hypothetical protein